MNEYKQEGTLAEGARRASEAKATGDGVERGRFSSLRKREAVLRLLQGESLERLSRELGTTAATRTRLAVPPIATLGSSSWCKRRLTGLSVEL